MPSKRKLDRIVAAAEAQLAAVQNRESAALPLGQQVKLGAAASLTVAKGVHRQRPSAVADRTTDRVWAEAEERALAELAAARGLRSGAVADAAAARIARKAGR